MAKWITFNEHMDDPKRVTRRWTIYAKQGGGTLGVVKWWSGWRRYCFFPQFDTLYEQDCLRDIADFCEQRTAERKAEREKVPA